MFRHISALAAVVCLAFAPSVTGCAAPTDTADGTDAEESSSELVSSSAYFETFQGPDGHHYFSMTAGNGQNVLRSQGYASLASKSNAERGARTAASSARGGIASVLANGTDASSYEVFETDSGDYAIRLVAANGEVIARGESYSSKSNAAHAVARRTEILSGSVKTIEE